MPAPRPLPTVTGRTENALRALLAKTLSATPISSYPEWVIVNALDSRDPAQPERWRPGILDALKADDQLVDDALEHLRLANMSDDELALTEFGRGQLAAARAAVTATTDRLVEGLADADQEAARRVLDHLRVRADHLLLD